MSDDRFQKLIRDLHVGVVVQGPRAEIVITNPAARALLGMTEDELTGLTSYDPLFQIVREDGSPFPPEERPVATVLRTRRTLRNVVMGVVRPDSSAITWLLVHAVPEIGPDEQVRQVLATLTDITDRKHLEASLRDAQKLESLGRLAGGVAHDFNNLLTIITSCTDLALREIPAGSPARVELEDALDAARRAAALTQQLLTFARRQPSALRVLDPCATLRTLQPILSRLLGSEASLTLTLASTPWRTRIDPSQFEQTLMNLVVNARDAMPSGGRLTIETTNVVATHPSGDSPSEFVCITVSDTGAGIDPAARAHMFEPFFTTKEGRGTGLGLATAHGVVERHGGFIELESEVGRGTTFRVYLPRTEDATSTQTEPGIESPIPARRTETILVVEDNPIVRRTTIRMLQSGGYETLEAADGRAALDVARANAKTIGLVLTDVHMPHLDGPGLARALRAEAPGVPVLFVSGYSEHAVPLELGRFLSKPFGHDELLAAVAAALVPRRG